MGLFFILLTFLPIFYNFYNSFSKHVPTIPMQNSLLQTSAFSLFVLSLLCSASMLPCGRYYYEPEGGYVGNSWVKFSLQYAYLYLAWFLHHLDLIDHYVFQFSQLVKRRCLKLYKKFTRFVIYTFNWTDNQLEDGFRHYNVEHLRSGFRLL